MYMSCIFTYICTYMYMYCMLEKNRKRQGWFWGKLGLLWAKNLAFPKVLKIPSYHTRILHAIRTILCRTSQKTVWYIPGTYICIYSFVICIRISRVGQNHIYTPFMTVYLMISLPKIPYIHRIYMVLANPTYLVSCYNAMLEVRTHIAAWALGCFIQTLLLCLSSLAGKTQARTLQGLARTIYMYIHRCICIVFGVAIYHTYGRKRCKYTVLANPTFYVFILHPAPLSCLKHRHPSLHITSLHTSFPTHITNLCHHSLLASVHLSGIIKKSHSAHT